MTNPSAFGDADSYPPDLIEVVAGFLYQNDHRDGRRWEAKSMPLHIRAFYHFATSKWIDTNMGGEAELFAFCEAVLATRGTA